MQWIVNVNIVTKKNWNPKSKWVICKLKKEKYCQCNCKQSSKMTKKLRNCFWVSDAVVQVIIIIHIDFVVHVGLTLMAVVRQMVTLKNVLTRRMLLLMARPHRWWSNAYKEKPKTTMKTSLFSFLSRLGLSVNLLPLNENHQRAYFRY